MDVPVTRGKKAAAVVEEPATSERPARLGRVLHLLPRRSLGLGRGECVVCIPVYGDLQLFAQCLHSVLRHTPPEVGVVVADDCSPDAGIGVLLSELESHGQLDRIIYFIRQFQNVGFVENVNSAFAACEPADVVVLNSDCVVAEGWFQGLRGAAYADSGIATSSAFTNHGTILSVPYRNRPGSLPQEWDVDQAAAAVRAASRRVRPRIPTAVGHCVYIKRAALDLVGGFDAQLSPGYGEEVDFSQRCVLRGMSHVAADDVLVWHLGGASFARHPEIEDIRLRHEAIIRARYPYYQQATAAAAKSDGALARALGIASRALVGISITIDGACLGGAFTGTQMVVLEVIRVLSRQGVGRLRVAVPKNLGREARRSLAQVDGVELLRWDKVRPEMERTDIVHRPYQLSAQSELAKLRWLGERVVITHLDMIAFRNPHYFGRFEEWELYQRATRTRLVRRTQWCSYHDTLRRTPSRTIWFLPTGSTLCPAEPTAGYRHWAGSRNDHAVLLPSRVEAFCFAWERTTRTRTGSSPSSWCASFRRVTGGLAGWRWWGRGSPTAHHRPLRLNFCCETRKLLLRQCACRR